MTWLELDSLTLTRLHIEWMPLFYLTECDAGLFGKNCVGNCSMTCGDPGVCDKVTGHCNGSCLAGWEGEMCENGKYVYRLYIYISVFKCITYMFYLWFLAIQIILFSLRFNLPKSLSSTANDNINNCFIQKLKARNCLSS